MPAESKGSQPTRSPCTRLCLHADVNLHLPMCFFCSYMFRYLDMYLDQKRGEDSFSVGRTEEAERRGEREGGLFSRYAVSCFSLRQTLCSSLASFSSLAVSSSSSFSRTLHSFSFLFLLCFSTSPSRFLARGASRQDLFTIPFTE